MDSLSDEFFTMLGNLYIVWFLRYFDTYEIKEESCKENLIVHYKKKNDKGLSSIGKHLADDRLSTVFCKLSSWELF